MRQISTEREEEDRVLHEDKCTSARSPFLKPFDMPAGRRCTKRRACTGLSRWIPETTDRDLNA